MIRKLVEGKLKLKGRSMVVAKNVFFSFGLRGFSILTGFLLISLYLQAVNQWQYGIILTITSILNFIAFFDVGIGNGLRNKLGRAIAENDTNLAQRYVATAYFYSAIIFLILFLIYALFSPLIDWHSILKIDKKEIPTLNILFLFVMGLFVSRFILQLIGVVLLADQKSYINDSIQAVFNLLTVVLYFLLKWAHRLDFYTILVSSCVAPVITLFFYTIILFYKKYKWLRPSIKFVDHSLRKDLLGLGVKFFIIQIIATLIYSTSNILIARLFNVGLVTPYTIAFKYYNVTVIIFSIIIFPFWGAFNNAWYQNDIGWIERNIKKANILNFVFIGVNCLQFVIYPFVSHYWLKQYYAIPYMLVISLICYNFIYNYLCIYAYFLNSIGQVNLQLVSAVVGGIINIPLTIWLARNTSLGLAAIVFANIISLLPNCVVMTFHTLSLIKKKKLGFNPISG